jgi:8-oxo-dGTP pyrophosphatase MutT (NUDIX family)/broad specificity phosphatase PhoE
VAVVRAAGAVLWRESADGPRYCLIHRPRYDDWSLPKGKLDAGEQPLAAAVREVREETGVRARPELRLPSVAYDLPDGTPKLVDFWLMRAADGPPGPRDDEADEVAWLPLTAAVARASYRDDVRLLDHVAGLPPVTAVLPLVRHAHAGKRGAFDGADAARPLEDRGWAEASRLAGLLRLFDPQRIVSATPLRCRQTVQPLTSLVNVPVLADPAFDEPADVDHLAERVAGAAARLRSLLTGERTVVCSQGKVIPPLLALLDGADGVERYRTPKGTGWALSFAGDRLIGLDRL